MRILSMIVPVLALGGLATCAPELPPDGAVLFQRHCVACHGVTGQGDGPLAQDLPVPPADLTRIAARHDGVFPMEEVMAVIHGYRGQEHTRVMPPFDPVLDGPKIIWRASDGTEIETPATLLALAEYVKGLGRSK